MASKIELKRQIIKECKDIQNNIRENYNAFSGVQLLEVRLDLLNIRAKVQSVIFFSK